MTCLLGHTIRWFACVTMIAYVTSSYTVLKLKGKGVLKTLLHPALAAIMCFCLCLRSSVCVPWSKHVTWSCASRVSKNILSFDARNNPPANFPVWRIEIFHEKKSKNKDKICEAHGTRTADHLHWRQTP